MADLRLHDQGWLSLPAELRQLLGVHTGDRLKIEMIEGGVRLRPAGQSAKAVLAAPVPAPAAEDPLLAKPRRGRPRKQVQTAEPQAELPLQPVTVRSKETGLPSRAASTRNLTRLPVARSAPGARLELGSTT